MLNWTGERYIPEMEPGIIHYEHLHRYRFAKEFIKDKTVLDLACGEGYGSFLMAEAAKKVIGIDIDSQAINHAKQKYYRNNLEFLQGSMADIALHDKIFDVIVCFEAIEHIKEQEQVMKEIRRLLKDDGILLISTPNIYVYSIKPGYNSAPNPFHLKELNYDDFIKILEPDFGEIFVYGQKVFPASNIFPVFSSRGPEEITEYYIKKEGKEFAFVSRNEKEAVYFIIAASNAPIPRINIGSYLADVSSSLFEEKDREINFLKTFLVEKDNSVSALKSDLKNKHDQISTLQTSLEHAKEEKAALKNNLALQIRLKDESIFSLQEELKNIKNSLTWKGGQIFGGFLEKLFELFTGKSDSYFNFIIFLRQKSKNFGKKQEEFDSLLKTSKDKKRVLVLNNTLLGGGSILFCKKWMAENSKKFDIIHMDRIGYLQYEISRAGSPLAKITIAKSRQFNNLLRQLEIDLIFINQIATYPIDEKEILAVLRMLSLAKVPYEFACLDFLCLCPSIDFYHNGNPVNQTDCKKNPNCNFSGELDKWRSAFSKFLRKAQNLYALSQFAKEAIQGVYPYLDIKMIKIFSDYGSLFHFQNIFEDKNSFGPILNIGVLGTINSHKGSRVVYSLAQSIKEKNLLVKLTVFGSLELFAYQKDFGEILNVLGNYNYADLERMVKNEKISFFVFPSLMAETFSFACDEIIQMGFPIVCFDFGAQKERIEGGKFGWLVPIEEQSQGILEKITELEKNRKLIIEKAQSIRQNRLKQAGNIIFITTHVKFCPVSSGNGLRIWNLIKNFKKNGYKIAVLYTPLDGMLFTEDELNEIREFVDYFYQIGLNERAPTGNHPAYEKIINSIEPELVPLQNIEETFFPKGAVVKAFEIIEGLKPTAVIAGYIWTSRVLKIVPENVFKIIDTIDKFSDKEEKVCSFGVEDMLSVTKDQEKTFLNRADIALAIQPEEAENFRKIGINSKVITAGVDFEKPENNFETKQDSILIVASETHLNRPYIEQFIKNVWPKIREKFPDLKLRIAGRACNAIKAGAEGIELLGFVKNIEEEYARALAVVNPVMVGTGLKIKTVQALACGRALVTTPAGADGLPKNQDIFLLAESAPQFANLLEKLLSSESLRKKIEANAANYAAQNFTPEKAYGQLVRVLRVEEPEVSIIIPVLNNVQLTEKCIESVENFTKPIYEIIFVDNNADADTKNFLQKIKNAKIITNSENLGFAKACNQGAQIARGKYIVLLNNDTEVTKNWLSELISTAKEDEACGAAGAKILFYNGKLQEAGCNLWSDGTTSGYGGGGDPQKPEYSFAREVDYCSGACLLIKTEIFKKMGGFDERFSPAYYEELDFCMRLKKNGYKTIYQPKAEIFHKGSASLNPEQTAQLMAQGREKFVEKWREELKWYPSHKQV